MRLCELFFAAMLLFCSTAAIGQTGCYDPSLLQHNSYCNPDFEPVCGCDGVTYKNECNARNYFGISYSTYGPCSNIAFRVRPNPVRDFLTIEIVFKYESNGQILIYDMQGNLRYRRLLRDETRYQQNLEVFGLPKGLYLVLVESGGLYEYQRFLKL